MKRFWIIPLLLALVGPVSAMAAEEESTGTPPAHNSVSLDWTQGSSSQALDVGLVLALSEVSSLGLSYAQSNDGVVTLNSYGLGWRRSSKTGWLGWDLLYSGEADNVEALSLTLELGLQRDIWEASIIPRLNTVRVYTQMGPKTSVNIISPGIAGHYTYRTPKWDFGVEAGINFYPQRLDNYANNTRLLLLFDPLALQMVSGLEQRYLLGQATRYTPWGEWGLQALSSVSAIDGSSNRSLSGELRFYMGDRWDLKLAYILSQYQQTLGSSYSLGVSAYW